MFPQTPPLPESVKSQNTTPELLVRSLAHRLGYRFRLHRPDLPGSPDLVFPARRKIIFVHGCFWHAHTCPRGNRLPKTNTTYWLAKRQRNHARDLLTVRRLRRAGWRVLIVWECQTHRSSLLASRLRRYLA